MLVVAVGGLAGPTEAAAIAAVPATGAWDRRLDHIPFARPTRVLDRDPSQPPSRERRALWFEKVAERACLLGGLVDVAAAGHAQ